MVDRDHPLNILINSPLWVQGKIIYVFSSYTLNRSYSRKTTIRYLNYSLLYKTKSSEIMLRPNINLTAYVYDCN